MLFGNHFKIKAAQRFEWDIHDFISHYETKKTLVEFCPNDNDTRVRPYFDFDGKAPCIEQLPSPEVLYPHLKKLLETIFPDQRVLCAYKPNRTCALTPTKTVHKLSFRFFVPDLYTYPKHMKKLVKQLNKHLRADEKINTVLKNCIDCAFDEGIYNRWRAMSVVGKMKCTSDPVVLQAWDISAQKIEDFLSTYIPEDCQEWLNGADDDVHLNDVVVQHTNVIAGAETQKFVAQHFCASICDVKSENDYVYLNLKKKICPFALREHSSNRQYIILQKDKNIKSFVAFEKCHKIDCGTKNEKIKKITVPDNVVQELKLTSSSVPDVDLLKESSLQEIISAPLDKYKCKQAHPHTLMPSNIYLIPLSNDYPCPICERMHDQCTNVLNISPGKRFVTCNFRPSEWYPNPVATIPNNHNQIIFGNHVTINNHYNSTQDDPSTTITNILPSDFADDKLPMPMSNMSNDDSQMFLTALNGKHSDLASWFYTLFTNKYRCLGHNREWFLYKQNVWSIISPDIIEYELMEREFMQPFADVLAFYLKLDRSDKLTKSKVNKIQELYDNLKTHGFRSSILKECEVIFLGRHQTFEEDLNTKNLLPCNNGVVDLTSFEFRPGHIDDNMSMSTKCDYIPYDPTNETVKEIEQWMALVQPDKDQRDYLKKLSGYFLTDDTSLQQIQIWTGHGRNGKSFYVENILKPALGQFFITGATQLLTRKRENASETNEALMSLLKKRLATFVEPEKNEIIQASIIKQLSGCDEITARGLHQKQQSVVPTFKSVLICNNIPKVSEDSYAVWRRIRIVDWPMTFKENPDPKNPHEALLDINFNLKVKHWAPYFLGCLVHWLKLYRKEGLKEPESVIAHTRAYQEENDEYLEFRQKYITFSKENDGVSWADLREKFREWHQQNISRFGGKRMTPRGDEVKKYFVSKLGPETQYCQKNGQRVRGFKNYKLHAHVV